MNESTDTPNDDISICTMDEQELDTQNTVYLQAEIVEVVTDEDNSLPEIHVELIKEDKSDEDNQEQDVLVTHFQAISETNSQRRSSTKF